MPWSGSGTYSLPPAYSPEVNGTTIDAARYNGLTGDVATGITACLAKNGENVPTANLPMGGFKHTGAADGSAAGQYIVFAQTTAANIAAAWTAAALIPSGSTVPTNGIYLPSANTLGFASNSVLRGTLGSSGNWNFAAPTSGTTITATAVGTARAAQFSGSAGNGLYTAFVDGGAGNREWQITVGVAAVGSFALLDATAVASRLTINSSGSFGFNTAPSTDPYTFSGSIGINNGASVAQFNSRGSGDLEFVTRNAASNMLFYSGNGALGLTLTSDQRLYGTALHNNAGAVTGTTNQYIASGTYTPTATNVANAPSCSVSECQWMRVGNTVMVSGAVTTGTLSAAAPTTTQIGISLPIASNFTVISDLAGVMGFNTSWNSCDVFADITNDRATLDFVANTTTGLTRSFMFFYEVK